TMDLASVDSMAVVAGRATEVRQLKRAMGKFLVRHTPQASTILDSCFRRALPTARPACRILRRDSIKIVTFSGKVIELDNITRTTTIIGIKVIVGGTLEVDWNKVGIFSNSPFPLPNRDEVGDRKEFRIAVMQNQWNVEKLHQLSSKQKIFTTTFKGRERRIEWDNDEYDLKYLKPNTPLGIKLVPAIECSRYTPDGDGINEVYSSPCFMKVDQYFYSFISCWKYRQLPFEQFKNEIEGDGQDGLVIFYHIDGKVNGQEVRLTINIKNIPASYEELAAKARRFTLTEISAGQPCGPYSSPQALKIIKDQASKGNISPGFELTDIPLPIEPTS
ncbi:hypothetical protein K0U07_02005, partial [bacterium]|nr:hypothetical protein [bacterium]